MDSVRFHKEDIALSLSVLIGRRARPHVLPNAHIIANTPPVCAASRLSIADAASAAAAYYLTRLMRAQFPREKCEIITT